MNDVTQILTAIEQGDGDAAEQLLPLVYKELRTLAAARMARESADHTLQATALVHEAYIRLVGTPPDQAWQGRGHFFAAAAEAMRRILVESARAKKSQKRGRDWRRIELQDFVDSAPDTPGILLDLDDGLSRLATEDAESAELVKLRLFAGLSVTETEPSMSRRRPARFTAVIF